MQINSALDESPRHPYDVSDEQHASADTRPDFAPTRPYGPFTKG